MPKRRNYRKPLPQLPLEVQRMIFRYHLNTYDDRCKPSSLPSLRKFMFRVSFVSKTTLQDASRVINELLDSAQVEQEDFDDFNAEEAQYAFTASVYDDDRGPGSNYHFYKQFDKEADRLAKVVKNLTWIGGALKRVAEPQSKITKVGSNASNEVVEADENAPEPGRSSAKGNL